MTEYFQRYADAFDTFDSGAIADFYQVPCLMVNDHYVAALTTEHAVRSNMEALCAYHRNEGYTRAHVMDVRVRESSPRVRHVEVDWRIDRKGGTSPWAFTNTYQLTRHETDWRILVSTTHGSS